MQNVGKIIYYLVFYAFLFLVKIKTTFKNKAWPRNSLLQSYFSFGRSDLDLSVVLHENKNLLVNIKKIQNTTKYFVIIKEMNFYYPFVLSITPSPINYFEWSRDIYLRNFIHKESDLSQSVPEKFVYFLRVFFSMKNCLNIPLDRRHFLKWKFHLNKISLAQNFMKPEINSLEVLQNVSLYFFKEKGHEIAEKIAAFFQSRENDEPLHIFINSSDDKNFYMTYFSHVFSFLKHAPELSNSDDAGIFLKQMSWEIWAMMTQPWLFTDGGQTDIYLKNLHATLLSFTENNKLTSKEAFLLINQIEQYQSFLASIRLN